jgi:threonyl-tRNA synthetase
MAAPKRAKPKAKPPALEAQRHSLAHVLAMAVLDMFPEAKLGVGPAIEDGFYYDFDLPRTLIPEDLPLLEKTMRHLVKQSLAFEGEEVKPKEAVDALKQAGQPYKVELAEEFAAAGEPITFYRTGQFVDLCRGGHIANTNQLGAFKLTKIAGAYWRGDETQPMLQRIYGVAFENQTKLDAYLKQQEEAKARDHRKLGQELDLFTFSDLVGAGLPLWTPKGTILRNQLDQFVQSLRDEHGYQEVTIPHVARKELYEKSGHWQKFEHELFRITTREGHELAMKPMNCPHHAQIYASRLRSYRELPVRYRETTTCYRDEQSGELSGLSRLRAFTQDDAHSFCRSSQIEAEILQIWDIVERFYGAFEFKLKLRLSSHDPENLAAYSGEPKAWQEAEAHLKKVVESKVGTDYEAGPGEAAFYGPKLDFLSTDALGREWQVATIQLDFNQPEGFDLHCVNEEGAEERIVMIHAAIMGSIDRFLAVLIEHLAGAFPLWLAPEQVRVLPIADRHLKYAEKVADELKTSDLRAEVDERTESIGKKIREAEMGKVPYMLIVGDKEEKAKAVSVRSYHRGDLGTKKLPALRADLEKEVAAKKIAR